MGETIKAGVGFKSVLSEAESRGNIAFKMLQQMPRKAPLLPPVG